MLHQTDLLSSTTSVSGAIKRINVGLNIDNLFDQDTVTRIFTSPYRDRFNVTDQVFFSGTFDPVATRRRPRRRQYRPDPRFLQPDQYQSRRQLRLNVQWSF